tara:strand:- start:115 stop:1353 length:1239 start_codon:yes stop_codon:yes gene_type:complete
VCSGPNGTPLSEYSYFYPMQFNNNLSLTEHIKKLNNIRIFCLILGIALIMLNITSFTDWNLLIKNSNPVIHWSGFVFVAIGTFISRYISKSNAFWRDWWILGILIISGLMVTKGQQIMCTGYVFDCVFQGLGALMGTVIIVGAIALLFSSVIAGITWCFSKRFKKYFLVSFYILFAPLLLFVSSLSLVGSIITHSQDNIDMTVWLQQEATDEERIAAIEFQNNLITPELSNEEISLHLDLLLDFFEYRGITREEIKNNPEFAITAIRNMYGAIADYHMAVVNSMLISWDKGVAIQVNTKSRKLSHGFPLYTDDLMELADKIRKLNPQLKDKVEIDLKMIELAAERRGTFLSTEDLPVRVIFALATVPPQQKENDENLYILNREVIVDRLEEIKQYKKNVDRINDSFESWLYD